MMLSISATQDSILQQIWNVIVSIFFSYGGITFFARLIIPVLAAAVLYRCISSMFSGHEAPEIWAYLDVDGYGRLPVSHWENTIGRSSASDIMIDFPNISRSHAVLIRDENKRWTISDLDSTGGITVNGKKVDGTAALPAGSTILLNDVEAKFLVTRLKGRHNEKNQNVARKLRPMHTLLLLSIFIFLASCELISGGIADKTSVIVCFGGLGFLMWAYYAVMRILVKTGIEIEMIAFFLSAIGFSVAANSSPSELYKQFFAFLLGFGIFIMLGWFLRDLKRVTSVKLYVMIGAIGLLLFNIIFGQVKNGARNWISIAGVSLQPSELVKIAFVFIGAATLDILLTKKNLAYFIGFSGVCIGALAFMGDFGTAAIFFTAFIVIAFMRSGDFATIALICATVVFGLTIVIKFKPYVARRFEVWGHAWEHTYDTGYQQTRTMSAAASGGLFGVGVGNGWLRRVVAADTDLVFGVVCEEWGLLVALMCVIAICALAGFTLKSAVNARSSFYVIAACAAVSMMVVQTILNTLGSVDLLPLTGVTFPFVSNGGSGMLSAWGLLAYVKAADTRRNASFAAARENFKVRIQTGGDTVYSSDNTDNGGGVVENKIGRSEYDFSKLGIIAEKIRIQLIEKGILKAVENVDYVGKSEDKEEGEGYVSYNGKKISEEDIIYSRPRNDTATPKQTSSSSAQKTSVQRTTASKPVSSEVKTTAQSTTAPKPIINQSSLNASYNTESADNNDENTTVERVRTRQRYSDDFDNKNDTEDSYIGKHSRRR